MGASRTGDKTFHGCCISCEYFRIKVQAGGRWLETCEATYEQLIRDDKGELKKSDFCPFTGVMIHV